MGDFVFPKTERGNDPADHVDDPAYEANVIKLINKAAASKEVPHDPFAWTEGFKLSTEEAAAISDPTWIIPNLIIQGHLIVTPAEPNGGKTTIFLHLSKDMVNKGYTVFYVNADVSGGEAKKMANEAKKNGVNLLLPDLKIGLSMDDVVLNLIQLNQKGGDFSGYVFIFDTLKKMTDVINKKRAKELYKVLRGLSAKGMTIILLAHTNKFNDAEGMPIYEGTGDLRADVDELIYLIPIKNPDGSMTVSTAPNKTRGTFVPITFEISPDREVSTKATHIDTVQARKSQLELEKHQKTIVAINNAVAEGKRTQTDIINLCKEQGVSKRAVQEALKKYSVSVNSSSESIWTVETGQEKNANLYSKRD